LEELIAYFPFTAIWVFDATSRKETYCVCVIMSVKQYNVRGCSAVDMLC
jgi:hypothetical protein